ncbi:MAG: hypothetical protein KDB03_22655 [Planctomycetales bacterium]|nr:hypothetical protein [Planctomycetales bacterium]
MDTQRVLVEAHGRNQLVAWRSESIKPKVGGAASLSAAEEPSFCLIDTRAGLTTADKDACRAAKQRKQTSDLKEIRNQPARGTESMVWTTSCL